MVKIKKDEVVAPESEVVGGIEVGDPQVLRPAELPLVVKPADGGEWKNDEQAEYARTLNAYAYKNPRKWQSKKDTLVKNLVKVGDDPSFLFTLKGHDSNLTYKDKRVQQ